MGLVWGGQCGLVVDAGFSFTHALPIFDGHLLETGVRRINLGGKLLTNYFKELVSYRSTPRSPFFRYVMPSDLHYCLRCPACDGWSSNFQHRRSASI